MKSYKGKPFALLGVDFPRDYDTPELLRKLRDDGTITWRFWYDKPPSPITRRYQIEGFPTLFLLDHRGVIRSVDHSVDEAYVEQLVREAERESGDRAAASPK